MRETNFINQNKEKWGEFEQILSSEKKDPDKLSSLFIQVSDDLSYSRTFYRNRSVRIYLNNLAQQVFNGLYRNRKSRTKHFKTFWAEELPQLIWSSRKALLVSFVVFALSVLIGVFSSWQDPEFPRVILGNSYVKMTLENIKKHDPMAVYKDMHEVDMFLGITLNNLKVSVLIFLMGLVFSIGSVAFLAYNGIMVGCFQYFFYHHGLFAESALTIWMHGTLEMSSILIAATAGITMGNGLAFPKTYTRMQSFMLSSRRGLKILVGVTPIIVFAAIIESFVTRYTELPGVFKLAVIVFSLFFILFYFVWLPWQQARAGFQNPIQEAQLRSHPPMRIDTAEILTNGDIFMYTFGLYRKCFKQFFSASAGAAVLYTVLLLYFFPKITEAEFGSDSYFFVLQLFNYSRYPLLSLLNTTLLAVFFFVFHSVIRQELRSQAIQSKRKLSALLRHLLTCLLLSATINAIILIHGAVAVSLLFFSLPLLFLLTVGGQQDLNEEHSGGLLQTLTLAFTYFWKFVSLFYLLALLSILFLLLIDSPFLLLYFNFLTWNFVMEASTYRLVFIAWMSLCSVFGLGLILPLILGAMTLLKLTLNEIQYASALRKKIALLKNRTNGKK